MRGTDAKPLVWLHSEIKTPPFSTAGRIGAGVLLRRLQLGERLSMPHSRAMQETPVGLSSGSGVMMAKSTKLEKLRRAGWQVGGAKEFLGLSDAEAAFIEIRVALSRHLRERRMEQGLSQSDLAAKVGSSQSRVAKMEAADPTVSLDLLVRSLLALGASSADIGKALRR